MRPGLEGIEAWKGLGDVNEQVRLVTWVVIAVGAILAVVSLFADPLGIGEPGTSFGWKQITGVIVGVALVGAGVLWTRRLDRGANP